jgi:hypothetical protein
MRGAVAADVSLDVWSACEHATRAAPWCIELNGV